MKPKHTTKGLNKSQGQTKKSFFTLIELLIVTAIISILLTIMIPSLANAYETAYRVDCAGNLANTGQTFNKYMVDTQGKMPFYNWIQSEDMRDVYLCPKDDSPVIMDFFTDTTKESPVYNVEYSYGFNLSLSGERVLSISNPSNFVMSFDSTDLYSVNLTDGKTKTVTSNKGLGNNEDGNDSDNPAHGDGSVDDDEMKGTKFASNENWTIDLGNTLPNDTSNWYYNNLNFRHLGSACHLMLDGSVNIKYSPYGGSSLLIQWQ